MNEFYKIKYPIAKKQHICEFCHNTIIIGEKYSYESGKTEDDFFTRTLCISCSNMLQEYCLEISNEFDWRDISDNLKNKYCCGCINSDGCDEFPENCIFIRKNYMKSGQ